MDPTPEFREAMERVVGLPPQHPERRVVERQLEAADAGARAYWDELCWVEEQLQAEFEALCPSPVFPELPQRPSAGGGWLRPLLLAAAAALVVAGGLALPTSEQPAETSPAAAPAVTDTPARQHLGSIDAVPEPAPLLRPLEFDGLAALSAGERHQLEAAVMKRLPIHSCSGACLPGHAAERGGALVSGEIRMGYAYRGECCSSAHCAEAESPFSGSVHRSGDNARGGWNVFLGGNAWTSNRTEQAVALPGPETGWLVGSLWDLR